MLEEGRGAEEDVQLHRAEPFCSWYLWREKCIHTLLVMAEAMQNLGYHNFGAD